MENDRITNALNALKKQTNESILSSGEKNALNSLIETLIYYYLNKCQEIRNSHDEVTARNKIMSLASEITDYMVSINDAIKEKNDAFCITTMIYKEINYDEAKGKFKRKRLI